MLLYEKVILFGVLLIVCAFILWDISKDDKWVKLIDSVLNVMIIALGIILLAIIVCIVVFGVKCLQM